MTYRTTTPAVDGTFDGTPARFVPFSCAKLRSCGEAGKTQIARQDREKSRVLTFERGFPVLGKRTGELGFEPRQADPESAVLPLHHSPKSIRTRDFSGPRSVIKPPLASAAGELSLQP